MVLNDAADILRRLAGDLPPRVDVVRTLEDVGEADPIVTARARHAQRRRVVGIRPRRPRQVTRLGFEAKARLDEVRLERDPVVGGPRIRGHLAARQRHALVVCGLARLAQPADVLVAKPMRRPIAPRAGHRQAPVVDRAVALVIPFRDQVSRHVVDQRHRPLLEHARRLRRAVVRVLRARRAAGLGMVRIGWHQILRARDEVDVAAVVADARLLREREAAEERFQLLLLHPIRIHPRRGVGVVVVGELLDVVLVLVVHVLMPLPAIGDVVRRPARQAGPDVRRRGHDRARVGVGRVAGRLEDLERRDLEEAVLRLVVVRREVRGLTDLRDDRHATAHRQRVERRAREPRHVRLHRGPIHALVARAAGLRHALEHAVVVELLVDVVRAARHLRVGW